MQLSPEQQQALDEQKAQCIFCQIIDGKIPSKEVFSDDKIIGILDINPASKGHILMMPKEHYPIMPLIPPETFKQLFGKTKAVDECVKKAMLCNQTTVLVANGGAAGQQSAHFMLHIIPREKGGIGAETSLRKRFAALWNEPRKALTARSGRKTRPLCRPPGSACVPS